MIKHHEAFAYRILPRIASTVAVLTWLAVVITFFAVTIFPVAAIGRATSPALTVIFILFCLLCALFGAVFVALFAFDMVQFKMQEILAKRADERATEMTTNSESRDGVVIFLRSFSMLNGTMFEPELHRRLKKGFSSCDIVRIGARSDYLGYSFANVQTTDENWKSTAENLLVSSIRIFCIPASSEGVQWELNQCFERFLQKTTFLCPSKSQVDASTGWDVIGEQVRNNYGLEWPEFQDDGFVFRYRDAKLELGSWENLDWLPRMKRPT